MLTVLKLLLVASLGLGFLLAAYGSIVLPASGPSYRQIAAMAACFAGIAYLAFRFAQDGDGRVARIARGGAIWCVLLFASAILRLAALMTGGVH
jgi:hypothetical protein